jgi:NAD(P)-dependent dehydrogenase (short-subunit alcohol dehydrogenase family)
MSFVSREASNMVRKIFVTGATSGIGEAIAQAFQAEGAKVIATGATDLEVQNALKKPSNAGIDFRVLDVRDLSAVQALVGALLELDVVVNCAGVIQRALELEPEAFARTVDINLNGTMRVCSAAREGLKARRGCIVNTASMLSFFGGGLVPGYSASKGGVAQLTKSLAIAYADDGIRVNAVAPGWIATPLTQALQDDPLRAAPILARTPMKRWGTPADVAGPVLFLASPQAQFVTGVVLSTIMSISNGSMTGVARPCKTSNFWFAIRATMFRKSSFAPLLFRQILRPS